MLVVGVLAVAGCTSDEEPDDPEVTASGDATPVSEAGPEWTVDELTEAVLSQEDEVLASVEGELAYQKQPVPVRFDVLRADAGELATVVHLSLTYIGDQERGVQTLDQYLSPDRRMFHDVRGIALQVPEQNIRFQPTLAALDTDPEETVGCLCSDMSEFVDAATPFLFTATFPPLDPGTRTVDLELVGFPLVEDIPVERG